MIIVDIGNSPLVTISVLIQPCHIFSASWKLASVWVRISNGLNMRGIKWGRISKYKGIAYIAQKSMLGAKIDTITHPFSILSPAEIIVYTNTISCPHHHPIKYKLWWSFRYSCCYSCTCSTNWDVCQHAIKQKHCKISISCRHQAKIKDMCVSGFLTLSTIFAANPKYIIDDIDWL